MMKKHIILCLAGLLIAMTLKAQLPGPGDKKMLYYFNGGAGSYFPLSANASLSEMSFVGSFQFQADYKEHLFGRFFFDQYNIAFHTKYTGDAASIAINGKVPSTVIGLDAGYRWQLNRFTPYAYVGGGVAITDIPFLRNGSGADDVVLTTVSRTAPAVRAGVGVSYKINRYFILYLEPQLLSFPVKTQVYDGMLNGMSIQLGFKTPLQ